MGKTNDSISDSMVYNFVWIDFVVNNIKMSFLCELACSYLPMIWIGVRYEVGFRAQIFCQIFISHLKQTLMLLKSLQK